MSTFLEIMAIIISSLFMLAAVGFTVVPILPGAIFVIPAVLVYGWMVTFEPFTLWFWIGQIVLMLIYFVSDNVAQVLGVKKMGGSKAGMIGGTIGMFALPFALGFLGPIGVILGPMIGAVVGAVLGEMYMRRKSNEVARVGWGAIISFVAGTVFKLVLISGQIVWFYLVIF